MSVRNDKRAFHGNPSRRYIEAESFQTEEEEMEVRIALELAKNRTKTPKSSVGASVRRRRARRLFYGSRSDDSRRHDANPRRTRLHKQEIARKDRDSRITRNRFRFEAENDSLHAREDALLRREEAVKELEDAVRKSHKLLEKFAEEEVNRRWTKMRAASKFNII